MSFCDPQIEVIPKNSISFEYPLYCKPAFFQNTLLQPFIQVLFRNLPPVKEYYFGEWVVLCFLSESYSPKKLRKAIVFDLFRYSNCLLARTTVLTSSIKTWNENHTFVFAGFIEKPLTLIHTSEFSLSKTYRKVYVKRILLEYRNGVSHWLQAWFPAWGSQAAIMHLEKWIGYKYQSADFLHRNPDNHKGRILLLVSVFNLRVPSVCMHTFV